MLSKKRPSCLKLKTFFNFLKANFCKTKGRVWSHLLFRIQIQQIDLVPDGSATLDSTIPIKLKGNRIPYSQLASSPKKFTVWFLSLQQIHTRVETKTFSRKFMQIWIVLFSSHSFAIWMFAKMQKETLLSQSELSLLNSTSLPFMGNLGEIGSYTLLSERSVQNSYSIKSQDCSSISGPGKRTRPAKG